MTISRRTLFKSSAIGAAALATPMIMTRASLAHETMDGVNASDVSQFSFGDFKVTVINDGMRMVDDASNMFGIGEPKEDIAALLEENFLPPMRARLGFAPTLVDTGSDVVLFDTGNGAGGREGGTGQLRAALSVAGYTPEQVSVVVITHMHPDHIGGLMEDGAPAFPNARMVTGQVEYDFWSSEDRVGTGAERIHTMVTNMVTPMADKTTFIGDGGEVVSGITGVAAFGHTPGHMVYRVESGGNNLMITADSANHPVLALQRPDWPFSFDADAEAASATRKSLFGMIASERIPFIGYHMPFPSVGYVEAMGDGFRWVPETYQLDL